MFDRIANWLIARAKKTPYFHLNDYMLRWWLVPYRHQGDAAFAHGIGPVSFWRRPIAWVLQRFDIAIRIHEIMRSDKANEFHDHPWDYITVILKGGYVEERPVYHDGMYNGTRREWHGAGSVLFRRATDWHRLEVVPGVPCVTLFITFKYRQKWGFLTTRDYKTYYRDFLNQHPERS